MELLASYASSDEEERVAKEQPVSPSTKKRKLSHLPAPELDSPADRPTVYSTVLTNGKVPLVGSTTQDKPWVRNVPHKDGNWASYVYIKVPNSEELVSMTRASVARAQRQLDRGLGASQDTNDEKEVKARLVENDLSSEAFQHLSLSRTLYLRSHHLEPFVADLKKALEWASAFTVGVSDDLSLLVNDEGTRSFLALKVDQGTPKLHKLVESVDDVLRKYRQPVYYQDPIFHVSVASVVGNWSEAWAEGEEEGERESEARTTSVDVDTVEVRMGKKCFEIPLREE